MQSVRVTQEKVATRPESDMHYAEKRQVGGGIQSTRRLGGGRLSLATQYAEMHRGGGGAVVSAGGTVSGRRTTLRLT
jgi:hypothetical protein